MHCKTEHFRNSPVPFTVNEWNNLDSFGSNKTCRNSLCGIFDPFGVRLINRLRLGFSHLREHEFTQKFLRCSEPVMLMQSWNWKYRAFLSILPKQLICSRNPYEWIKQHQWSYLNATDFIRVILYYKNFDVNDFKIITANIKFIKTTNSFKEALC